MALTAECPVCCVAEKARPCRSAFPYAQGPSCAATGRSSALVFVLFMEPKLAHRLPDLTYGKHLVNIERAVLEDADYRRGYTTDEI